jgi:hypothetical protein
MSRTVSAVALAAVLLFVPAPAFAHCDSLDGPVVKAATLALQTGDLSPVLRWVGRDQEGEVRAAFDDARTVRAGGARAQALADRFFFETVVRLHRQSEGEPYTGLKPAGHIDPVLMDADRALETGTADRLAEALSRRAASTLLERFAEARRRLAHAGESVEAGREYVEAYVAFMHFVEEFGALSGHAETPHPAEHKLR